MLYEISIWCARLVEKKRGDEPDAEDGDLDDDDEDQDANAKEAAEPGP